MALKPANKKAVYTVVDISKMSRDVQDAIRADAINGGAQYGLIAVEYAISGNTQTAIFGYYPGDGEKKWKEAQGDLKSDGGDDEEDDEDKEPVHAGQLSDKDLPPVDHDPAARRKPPAR